MKPLFSRILAVLALPCMLTGCGGLQIGPPAGVKVPPLVLEVGKNPMPAAASWAAAVAGSWVSGKASAYVAKMIEDSGK